MASEPQKYLPYGLHYIDYDDINAVIDVLHSDWLSSGPAIHGFENALSKVTDAEYIVCCSSGTAALHMAYMALGIGAFDRVIVPAISNISTANAAAYCGADILFTDVDPDTGLMRVEDIQQVIAGLTAKELKSVKAIAPVSLAGQVPDIEAINRISREHGWKVIIDSSQAIGSQYSRTNGQKGKAGDCSFADMEVFSFQSENIITTGEGGAITTNDESLYDNLCLLRNHGIQRDPEKWIRESEGKIPPPWYNEMQLLGYNYRLSDIHSALGLSQLRKLPEFIEKRRRLGALYDELLTGLSPYIRPMKQAKNCQATYHLYVVLVDFDALGEDRTAFVNQLTVRNIGSQVHYIPIHTHPFYIGNYGNLDRPGADSYYNRALSLPMYISMTEKDVKYVVTQIKGILEMLSPEGEPSRGA